MRLCLIRHATLLVEFGGRTLLIDPMLDDAGARPAIENSPNPRSNPLVPLPLSPEELVHEIDAVLVTHTHSDHWDSTAAKLINKNVTLFCQPEDEEKFRGLGFAQVRPIADATTWKGLQIIRTGGQHGTGDIAKKLAPVSGFVLKAPAKPTLYIAGDTIWCPKVEIALKEHNPKVTVLNAGGARFLQGDPITMTPLDVIQVCRSAPQTQVVAVHMEAINHCLVTRADLAFQLEAERAIEQVAIPNDGDWVELQQ